MAFGMAFGMAGKMAGKPVVMACAALLLMAGAAPATAQDYWYGYWRHSPQWRTVHGAIYELDNRIAYLQANPEIDEAYKAPIIAGARANSQGLNATLRPAPWEWPTPCCYGRRPIHIP